MPTPEPHAAGAPHPGGPAGGALDPYRAARAAFPGPSYLDWLRWLHDRLRPQFYCEIGVESGRTLALARPETAAVGVDPEPRVSGPLPPRARVFARTSDDFFLGGEADQALGGNRFDFGFIDGLHRDYQALRDFLHLERRSRPGAVIALHDVLPVGAEVATPVRQTRFWTGDTFRALLALTDLRPGLTVAVVPCYPSGLAVVTGLDPGDTTAAAAYDAAVAAWHPVAFDAATAELRRRVPILPNEFAAIVPFLPAAESTGPP